MAQAARRLRGRAVGRHLLAGRARREPGGPGHAQPACVPAGPAGALERRPRHRPRPLRPGHGHRRRPGRRPPELSGREGTTSWWAWWSAGPREGVSRALRCHGPAPGAIPDSGLAAIGPDEPDKADALTEADRRTAATSASGSSAPVTTSRGSMPAWTSSCSRRVARASRTPIDRCHGGAVVATEHPGLPPGGGRRHHRTAGPGGRPVALAAAIERLAMDPAERRRLGTAAVARPRTPSTKGAAST